MTYKLLGGTMTAAFAAATLSLFAGSASAQVATRCDAYGCARIVCHDNGNRCYRTDDYGRRYGYGDRYRDYDRDYRDDYRRDDRSGERYGRYGRDDRYRDRDDHYRDQDGYYRDDGDRPDGWRHDDDRGDR